MTDDKLRATPAARKLADELKLNLYDISGTGAKGRVHKEDVENYKETNRVKISPLAKKIAEEHNIAWQEIHGTGVRGKIMKKDVLALLPENVESDTIKSPAHIEKVEELPSNQTAFGEIERIPMSPMRKVIAQRMVESYLKAPVFALNYEVDMTNLIALRKQVIEPILAKTGNKVTFTDLIGLAVVKNLMKLEHRFINASLNPEGTEITVHHYVNLGIAVGLDEGLLVPVVKNAEKMTLSEFVSASKELIKATQAGKLKPDQMSGSTFSISNLGMFGIDSFNPIINQPNSAILGVAATQEKAVVVDGEIVIRPIMKLTLTIDHRVVDGMNGAKFMVDLKHTLENPMELLV
ncbi:dihydrolipoamide acetyltransferase [Streptococcus pneumoniae]